MTATKIRLAFAALALAVAGSANASIIDWGSITAPNSKTFSNYVYDGLPLWGAFEDVYTFTLTNEANTFGGMLAVDPQWSLFDIALKELKLFKGSTLIGTDSTVNSFSFSDLSSGLYSLHVLGSIGIDGVNPLAWVGYKGNINFVPDTTQVPEPGTFALMGAALLGMAFALRRRLFN